MSIAQTDIQHPIRRLAVHVWRSDDAPDDARFLAMFWPYSAMPIFFAAESDEAARAKAEAFRADAIEKHEAASVARREAVEKARASRAAMRAAS